MFVHKIRIEVLDAVAMINEAAEWMRTGYEVVSIEQDAISVCKTFALNGNKELVTIERRT